MKKLSFKALLCAGALATSTMFSANLLGCGFGNDSFNIADAGGFSFSSKSNRSIRNDLATFGFVADSITSSNPDIITGSLDDYVELTSHAPGEADLLLSSSGSLSSDIAYDISFDQEPLTAVISTRVDESGEIFVLSINGHTLDPELPLGELPPAAPILGGITLFSSTADTFSGDGIVDDALTGVSLKFKSIVWGAIKGQTPTIADGYPTMKAFNNAAFTVGGVATGDKDSSGNPTYGIKGAYFAPTKVNVGSSKTLVASSGAKAVTVTFEVTAGNTPLTLKKVSGKIAQSQSSKAELRIEGTKVSEGKDLTFSGAEINKNIPANTTETITFEIVLTADWQSSGEKGMDIVISDLSFEAATKPVTFECSVCHKEWGSQAAANACGDTPACPGYAAEGPIPETGSALGSAPTEAIPTNATVQILKAEGWLNSAYIIFQQIDGATYTVKCDDIAIDEPLIRYYDTYTYYERSEDSNFQTTWTKKTLTKVVRADAMGLKSGSHTMSVCANGTNGSTDYSKATMNVASHDRSGFAFTSSTTPGAYNKDGTLKAGTIVIYVTGDTAKTVSYEATTANSAKAATYTGLQSILSEASLKNLKVPLDIRIIGTITKDQMDSLGSSAEGIQIKTTSSYGVTVEGIGHDASVSGMGFLIRSAKYTELANLGIFACMDDGISIDTGNEYLWMHNNDIFYGATGGDSDQAKGDGALDFKKSYYGTNSYNHFWDTGKSNLLDAAPGSGTSSSNYLSYHHNWYDHSDSRHPRIRNASAVHVYNNYYDGNAKYGVGITSGASALVEGNFFRNANDPMMMAGQGTDSDGAGTFSGEEGGVLKSYNNFYTGNSNYASAGGSTSASGRALHFRTNKKNYLTGGAGVTNLADIDAYEVNNRSDTVDDVVTKLGGHKYSNFDTEMGNSGLGLTSSPSDPKSAQKDVVNYSGRHDPDFAWTFNNATEDENYGVIAALKSAVVAYRSSLVKIQGTSSGSSGNGNNSGDNGGNTDPIAVTGVTLDKTTAEITVGGNITLKATVAPADATNKNVTWSSSNTSVATVSSGKVTAQAVGTAIITVTTTDGSKTATCTVTVKAASSGSGTGSSSSSGNNFAITGAGSFTADFGTVAISGSMKSGPDPKDYAGTTYTTALKMETATTITVTTSSAITVKVITDAASKRIKLNGSNVTTDSDGIATLSLKAGENVITKGDSMNVYAIIAQ